VKLDRTAWLGRPWFFLALALLALNDHVLKGVGPGWLTGKLSDFAGLVVIATLASVLWGRHWGTGIAGVSFVALKTVPGVAEAVAPLLGGGVTLRDPSDLLALAALPLLWLALRGERPAQAGRARQAWAVIGLMAALLLTTATSRLPPNYVDAGAREGMLFAAVDRGDGFGRALLGSTDGGRNWTTLPSDYPPAMTAGAVWDHTFEGGAPTTCTKDATCFRAVANDDAHPLSTVLERRTAGSDWVTDGVIEGLRRPGDLAVDPGNPEAVIVAVGSDRRIYYRQAAQDWRALDLDPLVQPPQWQRDSVRLLGNSTAVVVLGMLTGLLCWLLAPGLTGRVILLVVSLMLFGLVFLVSFMFTPLAVVQLSAWGAGTMLAIAGALRLHDASSRRGFDPPSGAR
jgi:hypothetical protein